MVVMRHGGGCFSGKDPTKVDRSRMPRYVAKNIVLGLADQCEVQLAFAIGVVNQFQFQLIHLKRAKFLKLNLLKC